MYLLCQSTPSLRHQLHRQSSPAPHLPLQFRVKTEVLHSAAHLRITVKENQRFLSFQNLLREDALRGSFFSWKRSARTCSIQERRRDLVLAEKCEKTVTHTPVTGCTSLHRHRCPQNLTDLFCCRFAMQRRIRDCKDRCKAVHFLDLHSRSQRTNYLPR